MPELFTKNSKNKTLLNSNKRAANAKTVLDHEFQAISGSINDENHEDMPLLRKYNTERIHLQHLYRKIRKGLIFLCYENQFLSGKFMLNKSIPDDYIEWTRQIKETIMAVFLHEEIFLKLDFIGVTESTLDDMLKRLNNIDELKYQAEQEKKRKLN